MEAIELDAFRRRHEHDTFWCGLLLGGCGERLTTKLYTDRVCHFAHLPAPDGLAHECGRRARGVASADHLYVKSAVAVWARDLGQRADIGFAPPGGAPLGSVVDIRFKARGLRMHLDQTVAPAWDEEDREPVLGVSVPVDRDTLIARWYVHRVRLESEGTSRRVSIGTEAFARPIEWFALEECEMTERGLSTPATERVIHSRTTRPHSRTTRPASRQLATKPRQTPDPQVRAQTLLCQLAEARGLESVVTVLRIREDIAALTDVDADTHARLSAALADTQRWLEAQAVARQELFRALGKAVAAEDISKIRRLLVRANATASHDRTKEERAVVTTANACLEHLARRRRAIEAAARAQRAERREAGRVRTLLARLERGHSWPVTRELVWDLLQAASGAGDRLDAQQRSQIKAWEKRAEDGRPPDMARRPTSPAARSRRELSEPQLHAKPSRPTPPERKKRGKRERGTPSTAPCWQVEDVACPDCDAPPGKHCETSDRGPHPARKAWFERRFPSH